MYCIARYFGYLQVDGGEWNESFEVESSIAQNAGYVPAQFISLQGKQNAKWQHYNLLGQDQVKNSHITTLG